MPPKPIPTGRELEALKILWRRGASTVREIADALDDGRESLAYTTVLSLLQVMEQKGLVRHERAGKAYRYVARVRRESTCRRLAGRFLQDVFDGAMDEYLVHALRARDVSADELARLEAMIAEAKRRATKEASDE